MSQPTGDPRVLEAEISSEFPCCPNGTCASPFETSLVELAVNRIRDFVRARTAASPDEATTAAAPVGVQPDTTPAMSAPGNPPQEGRSA